jgi:phage terminase small subunit
MGKAKHPHDTDRPESPAVRKALARMDMEALGIALTPRQRRFCEEYTVDFNGSAAAVRAGYATTYPDRQANQLLNNKGVRAYIDHLTASKAAKIMSVTPDWIIQGIVATLDDAERAGDKFRGYELLARIMGMFIDRQEITGKDGGAIEIEQRRIEEETASVINLLNSMRKKSADKKDVHIVDRP